MEGLILTVFILIIISLNVASFIFFKKGKLNLMIAGIIMMILAPVLGFSSGALFLHFYDWSSGGTGEGAGYGGAFVGLITLVNGILLVLIGMVMFIIRVITKRR